MQEINPKATVYPVAEYFVSPQGEGLYSGTLFFFVRMAGCTVGRPYPKSAYLDQSHPAYSLPMYMEECHTIDGRSFACDTNFKSKHKLTGSQIMELAPKGVERFCITGGEPLMHDLGPLVVHAFANGKKIHVETSGTIPLSKALPIHKQEEIWVTCSPKLGALPEVLKRANEIKLLIDEKFDVSKLPEEIVNHPLVWIQAIADEHEIRPKNLELVLALQKEHPNWRISMQLHKVIGHFLNRIIR